MIEPARTVRRRHADRARMILDEAIRIIGLRGYYGFSIKELADNCGLSVAGVLHHFGSKAQLLVSLLRDRDERDGRAIVGDLDLLATRAAELTLKEVRALLRDAVVHNSCQAEIVRLYSMLRTEAAYPQHPAFDYFTERYSRAHATLCAMLDGKVAEPRSVALHLLSLMGGLEDIWLRDQDTVDLVAEWDRATARIFDRVTATDSGEREVA